MTDQFDNWKLKFPVNTVIELKGCYTIPRDKKERVATSNERGPLKGLAATRRKCEIVLYFLVEAWEKEISVRELCDGLQACLLQEAFLQIQAPTTSWYSFRIRSMENKSARDQILVIPLRNAYGLGKGESKNNRAFTFELFEKFMKNSRKVNLGGVIEDIKDYGSTGDIAKELQEHVGMCEYNFVAPVIPVQGVILQPGRLVSRKQKASIYEITPPTAIIFFSKKNLFFY